MFVIMQSIVYVMETDIQTIVICLLFSLNFVLRSRGFNYYKSEHTPKQNKINLKMYIIK